MFILKTLTTLLLTSLALAAPAAHPNAEQSTNLAAESISAIQGGPAWCTESPSGGGRANNRLTKDCCAATRHKAYFNEAQRVCMGYGGTMDNAVDHGKFGKCCDSRGGGSHGVNPTMDMVTAPV
ncbi:hypothetical protein EJ06DRAFT_562803 [Trichodelitschia bisporula]|uniref:Uncharacterized protein n=1 Tax=Trichodelitschia bisporula TaxID=703511 RepID=A0A6G1HUB5_9PEZI|nr:hypothetical protein EJ06DRAFT_562803 [Trichodelitschia bisporula]